MFRVTVIADFDTEDEAEVGMSAMEDAANRMNGDIQLYEYDNLDEMGD